MTESKERIEALEAKVAYQEHTIHTLNDEVYAQQKRIERLESLCGLLVDRYRELSQEGGSEHTNNEQEVPPHY